ncbi:MAG TPA: SpoIIE family protein phosphatase [Holophagaceae bacterium]|nr:SpoIIE family protein phosphatase [Holophagaceae bacterium]
MTALPRVPLLLAKALALGTALALLLHLSGLTPQLGPTLLICIIFSLLMWGGFNLLTPWFGVKTREGRSAFREALDTLLRILGLYAGLLLVAVVLVRVTTGLNLLAHPTTALLTFLIGLTITSVMTGLHTTERLVTAERAKAHAEVESLRLQLLEADHARKTRELEEARDLQLSMLPKAPPECCGMGIAYALHTATEVGGDTYDYRTLPDGGLLLAFGDATGHGLQAGLMVTAVKALFQTVPASLPLPQALQHISDGIRSLHMPRMAMALTLLRLEGDDLTFADAGMPPILHYRAAEDRVAAHRTSGPPLGQLKHFAYAEGRLTLAPGDVVLLASDGFPECLDPEDRMLGYDRMAPLFQRHSHLGPEALCEALRAEAAAWAKGRAWADDLSFLVIRRS